MKNYYATRTDWYPVKRVGPNISHYIYHDLNRNGIYDIEDQPMMKIAVKMTRPDGTSVVRRSNLNGFVNFRHSLTEEGVDVKEPGEYTFEVLEPNGWEITSNNKVQKVTYSIDKELRSGFYVDNVPEPVGIVPVLKISGTVKKLKENDGITLAKGKDVSIIATSPGGKELEVKVNKKGEYTFAVDSGIWELVFHSSDGYTHKRTVRVDRSPVKMSVMILGKSEEPQRKENKQLVDFENLTYSTIQKMPNGVAGLNWTNMIITHNQFYKGEGYVNCTTSGEYIGYNTSGHPVTIELQDGFDFYGAYFGVAWLNSAEGETLEVKAWRNEELVVDEEYKLSALGPFWLDADYRNITKLELSSKHYWQFVVDDMEFGI